MTEAVKQPHNFYCKGHDIMKKQTRSEAREVLFSSIFQFDDMTDINEAVEELFEDNPDSLVNREYIEKVLRGVYENADELDKIITLNLKKSWTLNRISKTSHVILKLAIYEMKYVEDVPPRVAINEAVELAKKYGTESDAPFVNGLLGSVYKEIAAGKE